jgi:hypothetical protein
MLTNVPSIRISRSGQRRHRAVDAVGALTTGFDDRALFLIVMVDGLI